ncbi:hypothetical protein ACIA59_17260 [Micromonospora haikouensis]|uniref:hypothetical protein n=1 Tax=Micromonospora haikouensis TaxID=686309 RepID=UPI0037A0F073
MTEWADALSDEQARRARREVCAHAAMSMANLGSEARRFATESRGNADQARCMLAAGLTGAIGCELLSGIVALASGRWAYGAAALVRQLVEVEYLAWAVGHDPSDAIEWLKSTKQQRLARWQPGKIRGRADGRFPNTDYGYHCEAGGHPTPEAARTILDNRDAWVEIALYEAAHHGSNAWHYLVGAFQDFGIPLSDSLDRNHGALDAAIGEWRRLDRLTELPNL